MISKLHYITQGVTPGDHVKAVEAFCQAGGDWVQLRIKDCSYDDLKLAALEARKICKHYNARLIINDNVQVALEIESDGIHLGKLDMDVDEARRIVGDKYIIGGTANTMEDIRCLAATSVDYVGVGPYRFTSTKVKLSPVLGLEGYKVLLAQCGEENIHLPFVAIGGLLVEDIPALITTGLHGVAISGTIMHAVDKKNVIQTIFDRLGYAKITNS